uniref:Uncharacterized protein n=1 Tax=Panagrolaimus superbus TaxID=310955 RepID=A0A914XWH1_9BILA
MSSPSSLLFLIVSTFILTDSFVKAFLEPQGYNSLFNNNRQFGRGFGMSNNFGFPPQLPSAASWNPYYNSGMLFPMNSMGFNDRTNFGLSNFGGGFGGNPMDINPQFPAYPNNGYSGFNEFIPSSNYGYGNQWPYYPNNNNNNGFTQQPYKTIPTLLPSSIINANTLPTTTTTPPSAPINPFKK